MRSFPPPSTTLTATLLVLAATLGASGPRPVEAAPPRSDSEPAARRVSSLLTSHARVVRQGLALPDATWRLRQPPASGTIPATLRFAGPLDEDALAALERAGATLRRRGGKPIRVGTVYVADLRPEALPKLATWPGLQRAESAPRLGPTPSYLTNNQELAEATQTWPRLDANGRPLRGAGTRVADIDGSIDIFHPSFFRADGPLLDWIDVDGDGRLIPGQDAVDLDGDGEAGAREGLGMIEGVVHYQNSRSDPWTDHDDGAYQPAQDWLFQDANSNGERDFGPEAGFEEQDPTYGELLLVGDDVNGDGVLGPNEKLRALGSSKLAAYYSMGSGRAFERGRDLIRTPRPEQPSHGTGVVGVLMGNQPGYRAFTGIAPDAELYFIDQDVRRGQEYDAAVVEALQWAREEDVHAVVHEYGSPMFQFNDGSSNLERTLDMLSEHGIVQCTAAHNFAGYPMHAQVEAPRGGGATFPLNVTQFPGYFETHVLYATLRWRGRTDALAVTLTSFDGEEVELPATGDEVRLDNGQVAIVVGAERSERGTSMLSLYLYRPTMVSTMPLDEGRYALQVVNESGSAQQLDLFVSDDSGYSVTVAIEDHLTSAGTAAWPSTADTAISVGAYRGNFEIWEDGTAEGALRDYSGRGPRIDGEQVLDVAAPDDTVSALFAPGLPYGHYETFAGTSGALPVVAGGVLLLLQLEPGLHPEQVRLRLRDSALQDRHTGAVPNEDWGWGKLAVYSALFDEAPPADPVAPVALVDAPASAYPGQQVILDAGDSRDPDGADDALQIRWDVGYDGEWDSDFGAEPTLALSFDPQRHRRIVAQVRDPDGLSARALVVIETSEAPAEDAGVPDGGAGPDPDAGTPLVDAGPSTPDSGGGRDSGATGGDAGVDGSTGGGGGSGGGVGGGRSGSGCRVEAAAGQGAKRGLGWGAGTRGGGEAASGGRD